MLRRIIMSLLAIVLSGGLLVVGTSPADAASRANTEVKSAKDAANKKLQGFVLDGRKKMAADGKVYGYLYTAHQQVRDDQGEPCINARSLFVPTNRFAKSKKGHDVSIYFDEVGDGMKAKEHPAHRRTGTFTITYQCEPLGLPLRSRATADVSGPNPWSSWTDVDSDR